MRLAIVLTIVAFFFTQAAARTWTVLADGTGDAPTIQAGLDSAAAGDTVRVLPGTYYEHDIVMTSGVVLLGSEGDPSQVVIDALAEGRVLFTSHDEPGTVIAGLTFLHGAVSGTGNENGGGGALCVTSQARFADCVFAGNSSEYAGGGLWICEESPVVIRRCLFTDNRAPSGGAFGSSRSTPTLEDCEFIANSTEEVSVAFAADSTQTAAGDSATGATTVLRNGGGVWLGRSTADVSGCLFRENLTSGVGAGIDVTNGSEGSIIDCRFERNSGHDGGGVGFADGDGSVSESEFTDNQADRGGSVFVSGEGRAMIEGSTFTGGESHDGAVAFVWSYSQIEFSDCSFSDNEVTVHGGVIHLYSHCFGTISGCVAWDNDAGGNGGFGHVRGASTLVVVRTTIAGNAAVGVGGGLSCIDDGIVLGENLIVAESGSGEAIYADAGCWISLGCSDLFGNAGGDWVGIIADQNGVDGNFSEDPLFCNLPAGDLTVAASSPCVAGNHPNGFDCGRIGALGAGCSGPTSVEHTSWGDVKKMFR